MVLNVGAIKTVGHLKLKKKAWPFHNGRKRGIMLVTRGFVISFDGHTGKNISKMLKLNAQTIPMLKF